MNEESRIKAKEIMIIKKYDNIETNEKGTL